MLDRINQAWRLFGTAVCFAAFGLGGALLGLVVFPLLRLAVRDPVRLGRIGRRLVQGSFAGHVWLMQRFGVMSLEVHGAERLRRPGLLVLANHPTLIDVVCLIGMIEEADCVVKSRLATNPFTRGPLRAAGYIFNDNGAGLIQDCIDSVRSGKNLVIFPEGTRTPRGEVLGPLQRGAANIAVRGALDVTPVLVRCSPPTLAKGEKWYRVPSRRFHIRIEVLPDIPVAPFLLETAEALAARRLTEHLESTFKTELARAGVGS